MQIIIFLIIIGVTFIITFIVNPENTIQYFQVAKQKVITCPGEALMCGSIVLSILILWPWKDDKRLYFRDFKEDCEPKKDKCWRNYSGVCQESDCPRMRNEL